MQRLRKELEKVVGELDKAKRNVKKGKKTLLKGNRNEVDSVQEKQVQDEHTYLQHLPWLSEHHRNNGHMPLAKVQSAAAAISSQSTPPPVPPRVNEGTPPLPLEPDGVEGTYVSISEIHTPPQKKNGGVHSPLSRRSHPPYTEPAQSQHRSSEYLQVLPMLQEQPNDAEVPTFKLQSPPVRNSQDDIP